MYKNDAVEHSSRNMISNMNSDMILAIDAQGLIVYANKKAENVFRQSRSDLVGRKFLSLVHPDFHKEISTYMNKQIDEKLPNSYYEYLAAEGGGCTLWLGQNTQLLIHNGQVEGLMATARDITYRLGSQKEQSAGQ